MLNRVEDTRFPNDICSVVKQAHLFWKQTFQSEHVSSVTTATANPTNQPKKSMETAVLAAYGAMTERTYDPTDGATHYHADYVSQNGPRLNIEPSA